MRRLMAMSPETTSPEHRRRLMAACTGVRGGKVAEATPAPTPEAINGGWSAWSACSKPCRPVGSASSEWGTHKQTCTDPAPANGGCACPFKVTPTGRLKQVPMGEACGSGAFTPNSGWCNNHAC